MTDPTPRITNPRSSASGARTRDPRTPDPDPGRPGSGGLPTLGAPSFPVMLRLAGARCLVVGAGPVAGRKVRNLLDHGAEVTVVAPEIGADVSDIDPAGVPGTLTVEVRRYRPPEAAGFLLVVSATGDPDVDAQVATDAAAAGALVNRADSDVVGRDGGDPPAGTVRFPGVHRDGPVTVTVSTDGASPAFSRWLRDRVVAALGTGVGELAALSGEMRSALLAAGRSPGSVDWDAALDLAAPLVADGRTAEARGLLERLFMLRASGDPPGQGS